MRKIVTIAAAILFIATTATTAQTTWHVKAGHTTGTHDGSSWANAFDTLQHALDSAQAGDTIWVANGIYFPTMEAGNGTSDRDKAFVLKAGVAIYGGFAGTETSLGERTLPSFGTPSGSVLSGDIGTLGDSLDNCYHVVLSVGDSTDAGSLDGFTITGGNADGSSTIQINGETIGRNSGGGMYNNSSSPSLTNVSINNNKASYGGGMFMNASSPSLTNVIINNNKAIGSGGGLYIEDSSNPILTDVTISNNTAGSGGGIYNVSYSSPTLTDVTISGNTAGYGGGIHNYYYSNPTLTNVTISGNTATSYYGGGMYNSTYSSPILTDVIISGNTASYGGGMYNDNNSSPTLTDVSISGNMVDYHGGGIYNTYYSNPILVDVSINNNTAGNSGSGMYNESFSSPTLTNVTISGNTAIYHGGGMYNTNNSSPTLTDVTINGNTANYGGGMHNYHYSSPTLTNVIISNNTAGDNGGGMGNTSYSSPILTNVIISNNTASNGGGMYNDNNSSPTLTDVTISGNMAIYHGGGMYNINSSPTLIDVTISGNTTVNYYGGGIYNTNNSSPILTNVIISNNTAANSAGGMYNGSYSSPTLTNVTISENMATGYYGGGMYNESNSSPILTNVTISGNTAGNGGGGMYNYSSSPELRNTVIWGNSSGVFGNGSVSYSYCLIQEINEDTNGCIDASTVTVDVFLDTAAKDYHLAANSPCINAGFNGYNTETTDLSGNTRIIGGTIDIGAYEYNTLLKTVTFESNGGTTVFPYTNVAPGNVVPEPVAPTKVGSTFEGWYADADFSVEWNFSLDTITQDTTLYAKWELITQTLSFDCMGGVAIPSIEVPTDSLATPPTTPIKAGHTFVRWYKETNCIYAWNFSTDRITQDTTLYAKWEKNTYLVTFESNGGSNITAIQASYGTSFYEPKPPTKANYIFVGWYKEISCSTAWDFSTDVITQDTTLYAKWAPTVSIAETQTSTINIYPNPAQNTLYIQSSETIEQVSVYDISGRMLLQTNSQSIDISHLANGIYIIKVKTAQGETVRKIMIND